MTILDLCVWAISVAIGYAAGQHCWQWWRRRRLTPKEEKQCELVAIDMLMRDMPTPDDMPDAMRADWHAHLKKELEKDRQRVQAELQALREDRS